MELFFFQPSCNHFLYFIGMARSRRSSSTPPLPGTACSSTTIFLRYERWEIKQSKSAKYLSCHGHAANDMIYVLAFSNFFCQSSALLHFFPLSAPTGERAERGGHQGQGDRQDHRRGRPDRHRHRDTQLPLQAHDGQVSPERIRLYFSSYTSN